MNNKKPIQRKKNYVYSTYDLWFAAALLANNPSNFKGAVWDVQKDKAYFMFETDKGKKYMNSLYTEFWKRNFLVDANSLNQSYTFLRCELTRLKEEKNENGNEQHG